MPDGLTFYLFSNFDHRVRTVVRTAADRFTDAAVRELSHQALLSPQPPTEAGCILIDLDQTAGLDAVREFIVANGQQSKIILISERADLKLARQAFPLGVFDCLAKPVDPEQLLDSIARATEAIRCDRKTWRVSRSDAAAVEALTPRELEYFSKLLEGWSIKTLSTHFQVSIQTAAKHRSRVLAKLNAENEVELVHRFGTTRLTFPRDPGDSN
ncbi:response regulator transcription factor [Rosistilla oblonga]|uniref:response regulator transcription factor n=1 Tax=Rosistilla oblonga TaxID=2527990 RepID=UPI003A9749AF